MCAVITAKKSSKSFRHRFLPKLSQRKGNKLGVLNANASRTQT